MSTKNKIEIGVLHCSATPAHMTVTKEMLARWGYQRGWRNQLYGYRSIIHQNGYLEVLVPYDDDAFIDPWEITNGASGYNLSAIHFCYIGGVDKHHQPEDTRTPEQVLALRNLIFDYTRRYPWIQWCGHNQLTNKKACPSFSVPEFLRSIDVPEENISKLPILGL